VESAKQSQDAAKALFRPLDLRGLKLPNRIVIAPMCQYSATGGRAGNWHIIHLGSLALSGAGLMLIEATGVEPRGRITPHCLGLYDDATEAALASVLQAVREYSEIPIGIQLAHAGRKASVRRPWDGRGWLPSAQGGWSVVGPSAIRFDEASPLPNALDDTEMEKVVASFVAATRRADRLGIDLIELHGAHGYLISSFLSPLANRRVDDYGGSLANRMRFPLELFDAVRAVWPKHKPLGMRINGTDWHEAGITLDEAVAFATELARHGCDFIDVSSGGNAAADVPVGPGYQVPLAARIRRGSGLPTMAVGMIRDPYVANAILEAGDADMIALARGMLNDPRWPWHAAEDLGAELTAITPQIVRGAKRAGAPGHLEGLNRKAVAAG
jgi:2,4-dienoyl-CoA reductase-like NADH-dependent reductase (Old Yellow Enzyme family)